MNLLLRKKAVLIIIFLMNSLIFLFKLILEYFILKIFPFRKSSNPFFIID
jgi:hypothetical protein